VAAERAHNDLISGVENFKRSSMKHTETDEKNPLPPIEGIFIIKIYALFALHDILPFLCFCV
jgi:hypothetical protein